MAYKFRFRVLFPLVKYVVNLISQRKVMNDSHSGLAQPNTKSVSQRMLRKSYLECR